MPHSQLFTTKSFFLRALMISTCLTPAVQAEVADAYRIDRLGFTGPGFISTNGDELSGPVALNPSGLVIGFSARYSGSDRAGTAGWIDDGSGPVEVGLAGDDYLNAFGLSTTNPVLINAAGQAVGTTSPTQGGAAAWIDDGSGATRLGLIGSDYQRFDGYQNSEPAFLNDQGLAAGHSTRYDPSVVTFRNKGQSAWLDDGSGPTRIGLIGDGYLNTDNDYTYSEVRALNQQGLAAGISERFNGSEQIGQAAWLDDGSGPIRIGFTGNGFQDNTGVAFSTVQGLSGQGVALGWSEPYSATQPNGRALWLDDGSGPVGLGFTDAVHTSSTGRRYSEAVGMNPAGQVTGFSERYEGDTLNGRTAWVDDGSGPRQLGLTGDEYRRASDGFENSLAGLINGSGTVVGQSARFDGSDILATDAWIDDGGGPVRIGLVSENDTNGEPLYIVSNEPIFLNEQGQVAGEAAYAEWPSGSTRGPVGWFYDPQTQTTTELLFSIGEAGSRWTQVRGMLEDGTVFGTYLGDDEIRVFAWDQVGGFVDLGDRASDLSEEQWRRFADTLLFNDDGLLVGGGDVVGQTSGESVYLIRPIPEPSTAGLALVATLMVIGRRRRH